MFAVDVPRPYNLIRHIYSLFLICYDKSRLFVVLNLIMP